jgi:hypothetical protein
MGCVICAGSGWVCENHTDRPSEVTTEGGCDCRGAAYHADNPLAIAATGAKGEVGYVLAHEPKSFDWRQRNAHPHPWGTGHAKLLGSAPRRFDTVFAVCDH